MTVAVSCNLADGVVLGVDSAVTIGNVLKVYENAEKLFQLGEKPIGIATFGIGALGTRGIGSYIREFEVVDPNHVVTQGVPMNVVVEELRKFFSQRYFSTVVPEVEAQTNRKFDQIPDNQKPLLGLVVGGFSSGSYLSQVWLIIIPFNASVNTATIRRNEGNFGCDWFSLFIPICRYAKGYDPALLDELIGYFTRLLGRNFTAQENTAMKDIIEKYVYQVPFNAMPIEEGVALTKFLVEMVINHHRFTIGAPVVGGKARLGLVTYKGEKFQILK